MRMRLGKKIFSTWLHRTLRFTPDGEGYRAENLPLKWDSDFGAEAAVGPVVLHNFAFPFSGKKWDSFSVGTTGSITFGPPRNSGPGVRGGRGNGFPVGRFDQLSDAASALINTVPGISVFLKPRMSGPHYVNELPDRVVVTWSLTEPYAGIQDFTWKPNCKSFPGNSWARRLY